MDTRGVVGIHAGRTTGKNDGHRVLGEQLLRRIRMRHDLGVNVGLAHPAGDQLGVLGAVVNNKDRPVGRSEFSHPTRVIVRPIHRTFDDGGKVTSCRSAGGGRTMVSASFFTAAPTIRPNTGDHLAGIH